MEGSCVCVSVHIVTLTLSPSGGSGSKSTLRWMSSSQASRSCDFLLYWYHWGAMANAFLFRRTRRSYMHVPTQAHRDMHTHEYHEYLYVTQLSSNWPAVTCIQNKTVFMCSYSWEEHLASFLPELLSQKKLVMKVLTQKVFIVETVSVFACMSTLTCFFKFI